MLFMFSTHGVLAQLRGSSAELKGNRNEEKTNGEKKNEIKREKFHSRGRRKIVERLPPTFTDPLTGKEDTRKHRVQLLRHLREKIINTKDGEMKQRMRSQLAFMYQLPTNEEDEHEIEILLRKINADKGPKEDHRRLVRELAKFIKSSRRRHRIEAVPHHVPFGKQPSKAGRFAMLEAMKKHQQQEKYAMLAAIERHKRKLQESVGKLKPEMAGMPEMLKGKPQNGFNLKPKKIKFPRDLKASGNGIKKKPVMHQGGIGAFNHHAKKIKESISKLNKMKRKEALKKSIEALKKASAEAMKSASTEDTQKPVKRRHVAKHLKKSIEALTRKHQENHDKLKQSLEAIKKNLAGLKKAK